MKKTLCASFIMTLLCTTAMSSAPAFGAHPYRIDPSGAKATGSETSFALGEAGSFSCSEAVYTQPNATEKELVTEEQGLTTTYSGCSGKLGTLAVKVTVSPEVNYKLSARKGTESETKFNAIQVSLEKELVLKIVSGKAECTVKASVESNQKLAEMQWADLNTNPGERLSIFTLNLPNGKAVSSGGTGCKEMALDEFIRWVLTGKAKQSGES